MFDLQVTCPKTTDDCSGNVTIWAYLHISRPAKPGTAPGAPSWPALDRKILGQKIIFDFGMVYNYTESNDCRMCTPARPISGLRQSETYIDEGKLGAVVERECRSAGLPVWSTPTNTGTCFRTSVTFTWQIGVLTLGAAVGGNITAGASNPVPLGSPININAGVPTTIQFVADGPNIVLNVAFGVCCPACSVTPDPRVDDAAHYSTDAHQVFDQGEVIIK